MQEENPCNELDKEVCQRREWSYSGEGAAVHGHETNVVEGEVAVEAGREVEEFGAVWI